MDPAPPRGDHGRGLGWRVAMLVSGAAVAGAGVAMIVWPPLLSWLAGGALAAIGLVLVVSALAARGR